MSNEDWYEEPPAVIGAVLAVLALIAYVCHELILHAKDIFYGGVRPCISTFWTGFAAFTGVLVGSVGATATSITLISCVAIPVTTITIYTVFKKIPEREKPRALLIALSLFLDPLFIDFFRDEIGVHPLRKLLVGGFGAVTFLAASYFWNLGSKENADKTQGRMVRIITRTASVILFLLPALAMLGYTAAKAKLEAKGDWNDVFHRLTPDNTIGLLGLLAIAGVGIGLSRYYEAP